jgi:hypothetical protein
VGVFEHVNNVFFDEPICRIPNPTSLYVSTDTNGIEVASTSTSTDSNCTRVLVILRLPGVAWYDVVVHDKSSILCIRYEFSTPLGYPLNLGTLP